jgi:hypothetical protein
MDDTKTAAQSEVEAVTTQTDSPTVEAPTIQEQTDENQVSDLPETTEEQRRAFQEMRQEIKSLKEERVTRERSESAFDAFRPKSVPNQVAPIRVEDYTDPYTQNVDLNRYNEAVNARLQRADLVASQANTNVQDQLDEYQARQKHPDLFADPDVEQEIADRWFAAKMRGENVKVTDIASKIAKRFEKVLSKAEKQGAEKVLQEVTQKEQASFTATGQTSSQSTQAMSDDELEKLRVMSRGKGRESEAAIASRIKGVPYE